MSKRAWTVVWVPHGSGSSRTLGFSRRALKVIVGTLGVLAVVTVVFVVTAISKAVDISRLERLQRANDLLAQELVRTRSLLDEVSDTVAVIMARDRQVRVLAGLPPPDPGVQLAGIGGPAGSKVQAPEVPQRAPLAGAVTEVLGDPERLGVRNARVREAAGLDQHPRDPFHQFPGFTFALERKSQLQERLKARHLRGGILGGCSSSGRQRHLGMRFRGMDEQDVRRIGRRLVHPADQPEGHGADADEVSGFQFASLNALAVDARAMRRSEVLDHEPA